MAGRATERVDTEPRPPSRPFRLLLAPDATSDEAFERLARLAMLVLDAKIAMVSLVDGAELCVVSAQGVAYERQLQLSDTICSHTASGSAPLLIEDARVHELARDSVGVRDLGVVGYAGVPLAGATRGSFCVMDDRPRAWSDHDVRVLEELAALASHELELRRRAELERAQKVEVEAHYETLVENLPLVAYIDGAGEDVSVKYMNRNVEELLGYSVEEWLTQPGLYHSIIHPDDFERVTGEFANTHARSERCSSEYRLIARDGRVVWVLDETVPVLDANGEAVCFQGFWLNISRRKAMELELVELASVVESSDDAIIGTSLDGIVRSWNTGAERIYGYAAAEMIGRSVQPLVPAGLRYEVAEFIERVARGERIRHHETTRLSKDGRELLVSLTISPIRNQTGELVGASTVARDMTEQRLLEAHMSEAQRVEALGRLAGGIAHDFNNLLTAITGYGTFLVAGLDDEDPLRRDAEEICKAAERAAALTRQLLAYSRRQVLTPEILSLNEIVEELRSMLPRVLGEDLEVVTRQTSSRPWVEADRSQIEQVLLNLAVNARDAMPTGGRLTIATLDVRLSEARAQAAGVSPGRYVALVVDDSGHGMDETTRKHIFEPFFTTKEIGKGTGLGLSSVYGIVKQSGGFIELESEPGAGASFTIYLPAAAGPAPEATDVERVAPIAGGHETVLLVEDEDSVRRLARRVLERAGYAVLEAENSTAALAVAAGSEEPIDLLLTDVVMPGPGGPELAASFAASGTPVIFMSGYPAEAVENGGAIGAAAAFIQKPFTPSVLAGAVRDALDRPR